MANGTFYYSFRAAAAKSRTWTGGLPLGGERSVAGGPLQGGKVWSSTSKKISSLSFVDVLYIRCDWRNVQSRPGRLDLHPVWSLTLDAAKRKGLRVAFRVNFRIHHSSRNKLRFLHFCKSACRWCELAVFLARAMPNIESLATTTTEFSESLCGAQ